MVAPKTPRAPNEMFGEISSVFGHRILLYGPGGIGKTTLCATAPGPVAIFDLDDSLPVLAPQLAGLDVRPVAGVVAWPDITNALYNAEAWGEIKTMTVTIHQPHFLP